jgi:hypothetical protein
MDYVPAPSITRNFDLEIEVRPDFRFGLGGGHQSET